MSVYVWAKTAKAACGLLAMKPDQAPRYVTEADALEAKGAGKDGFPGEALYRVTVEEIQP